MHLASINRVPRKDGANTAIPRKRVPFFGCCLLASAPIPATYFFPFLDEKTHNDSASHWSKLLFQPWKQVPLCWGDGRFPHAGGKHVAGAAKAKMEEKMFHFETLTQIKRQEAKKKRVGCWLFFFFSSLSSLSATKTGNKGENISQGGRGGKRFIRPRKKD